MMSWSRPSGPILHDNTYVALDIYMYVLPYTVADLEGGVRPPPKIRKAYVMQR